LAYSRSVWLSADPRGLEGGIVGGHQADAAEVAGECYLEGCGFMVVGYAFFGIILGAILGAILGGLVASG
jgi:predicted benzoate:H+ symporter BenE